MKFTMQYGGGVLIALSMVMTACGGGGTPAPKGDPELGKAIYVQCSECHQPNENVEGPRHCGVVGRPAASIPDFEYSQAMRDSGLVWNEKTLDEFLTSPFTYVNGTKMGFAGLDNPKDRADVIAYLKQVSADPSICPQ